VATSRLTLAKGEGGTQRVTSTDLSRRRIRLPNASKPFFAQTQTVDPAGSGAIGSGGIGLAAEPS
jgi:hypothetical protein